MSRIAGLAERLALPVVSELGLELWDVEFVKEAGGYYLRVYIDKPGGVSISDCEAVSRALDPALDEADFIDGGYTFEVSSAGAERQLKRPSDFERFIGSPVEVRLYKAVDGKKIFAGILKAYDAGAVIIEENLAQRRFEKEQVAKTRLRIE